MLTLCIGHHFDPNRIAGLRTYAENEMAVIRTAGCTIAGYYLPTDFAGPTNVGHGLIEFAGLANYDRYRQALDDDPGKGI